jgi:hypothetical protein
MSLLKKINLNKLDRLRSCKCVSNGSFSYVNSIKYYSTENADEASTESSGILNYLKNFFLLLLF